MWSVKATVDVATRVVSRRPAATSSASIDCQLNVFHFSPFTPISVAGEAFVFKLTSANEIFIAIISAAAQ